MEKKINVLVYGMTSKVGGMEMFFMNYYRNLNHTNVHFDFLCNYETMAFQNEVQKLGDSVFYIAKRSDNIAKNKRDLLDFFNNNAGKYQIAYMMALDLSNIDFLKEAKREQIPIVILHSHNSGIKRQNKKNQILSEILHKYHKVYIKKYATDFWACSKAASLWLFPNKLQSDVKIIHNAIDLKSFKYNSLIRDKVRRREGVKTEKVFGHVGRFADQKNPLFLIDVFCKIHDDDPNAQLWMIGDGPLRNQIESKINKLNLRENVKLFGQRGDVNELMQAMDAFIFPSLFEGLSLVMVEAQAAGLPIFASDRISIEHRLTDNIEFLPLEWTDEKWAKHIEDNMSKYVRSDTSATLREEGYDINHECSKLGHIIQKKLIGCEY